MHAPISDPIDAALAAQRWETARRLCVRALGEKGLAAEAANRRLFQLHAAVRQLADSLECRAALARIAPQTPDETFHHSLLLAEDFDAFASANYYRLSPEAAAGLTLDEYGDKMRREGRSALDRAAALARSPEQKAKVARLERRYGVSSEIAHQFDKLGPLAAKPFSSSAGSVSGTIRLADGAPAAGLAVTLGLEATIETPDPETYLTPSMDWRPRIAPLEALRAETDAAGRFRFAGVPAGRHEFLAVTLDGAVHEVAARFLVHGVEVAAGAEAKFDGLVVADWKSAPALPVADPFAERIERDGRAWKRVHRETIRNPFHFDFPRQIVSFPLPPGVAGNPAALLLLSSEEAGTALPFQLGREGLSFFMALPRNTDRVVALYEAEQAPAASSAPAVPPPLALVPEKGGATAVLDTGRASFRLPFGEGADALPPLLAVRGEDGRWRGEGRFVLPAGLSVVSRRTTLLESGPLLLSARIDYRLSNEAAYSWTVTAHRDEAYLLVDETSPAIPGAAVEFSLREFSGGRGFLHWTPENGNFHWSDLKAEDRELVRIQESVAWWIPPQGFGYAMTAGAVDGESRDYIGAFSRLRGDWIDRKFAAISQGPGDDNRELDWPFPEMVGSTVSMITAHTDASGDAFFRFPLFDGLRKWGLLVSTFERNDGPWKEISAVQHKNSTPRLQEFKEWRLDEADAEGLHRPHVVARRSELRGLRRKKGTPLFSRVWKWIEEGRSGNGPSVGLRLLVGDDLLAGWTKKLELVHAAPIRAKMVLLGRDFGDAYSPVGARPLTPWTEEYDLLAPTGIFTPEEERSIRRTLMLMGHMHMSPDLMNWKYNSRNANFEADRVDVVGTVGICFLGNPDARRFVDHGIELMERSLNVYCTPGSGKWYENPSCYYLHASKCRLNLVYHLFRHGLFDATAIPRLKDFLRWGILLLQPKTPHRYEEMRDGLPAAGYHQPHNVRRIPPVGDHAHIGPWVPDHYALMAQLYRKSDPAFADMLLGAYQAGGSDGGPHWGNPALFFASLDEGDLKPALLPELPTRRLEGFGAVFRDRFGTEEEFYLLFKQGPGGYRYHRTEGSIILFAGGRPLIYDGGEAGETWRHTTLSFYDARMPLAAGHVERFHALPGLGFVQGVHPEAIVPGQPVQLNDRCEDRDVELAHKRFAEPNPVNVRSLFVVRDEYIVMHDDLRLDPAIPCRWHLQAVSDAHEGGWKAPEGYRFKGRFGVDLQVALPGQDFVEENAERLPILDYHRKPEDSFAMRHLCLRAEAPGHYLAVLRPLTGDRKPVSTEALRLGKKTVGVAVRGAGIDDRVFLGRDAFAFASEGIRFEGRYGAVVRRGAVRQLFLLAGTLLEADGFRIVVEGEAALRFETGGAGTEITAEGKGRATVTGPGLSAPVVLDLSGGTTRLRLG